MPRYFITLSYDGAEYHGWQIQPNARTVQEELEKAVSTIMRCPMQVVGAGRTDTGVNASMMVAHIDMPNECDTAQFIYKLNRILPPDIAIKGMRRVRDDAHARFDATGRKYRYYVTTCKSPFNRRYCCRIPADIDFDSMNKAASALLKHTDFTSFSKLHTDVKTNNCEVRFAAWSRLNETDWVFEIEADRFLRNMVRAIVGTLLQVGRGRISTDDFNDIIEQKRRCAAGDSAPGEALFLSEVKYPEEIYL